ncbi:MAG: hypothetical protein RLZZ86_1361 [Cyanobacteriota bacterium]|jgi:hypothetical protein
MNQNSIVNGLTILDSSLNTFRDSEFYADHLTELFNNVPLEISDYFGFEYKLDKDEVPDLLICIHKPESLKKLVQIQKEQVKNNLKSINSLSSLENLVIIWESKFREQIKNIWLEFDSKDLLQQQVDYSFFYAPNLTANILETALVNDDIYQCIMGEELNKEITRNLVHCYKSLPSDAYISQIGMMKARSIGGLRLFIQNIASIPEYLESLSYPFCKNISLYKLLDLGQKFSSKVELDIDIKEKIQEKIGLEYYFSKYESAFEFINECQSLGYCSTEILDRIKSDSFNSHEVSSVQYKKCFSHFKINFEPEKSPVIKAYIGLKNSLPYETISN